ncbi:MAG: ATP-binding protein [Patescibacteria group bacterium]
MKKKLNNHKYYNYVAFRTAVIYIVLSALWILFSDKLLLTNPETAVYISTVKGWFYTVVVGIFIYFTLAREINLIQKAEKETEELQLLLKSSLDSQKDTILLSIDKNYNYLYFNKALLGVAKYAYGQDIKLGDNSLDIMPPEDRAAAKESYDRSLNGESFTTIHIYGDKNKAYYESFFNPIINDRGEIIGVTVLAKNVTERIKMEENNKWLASFPLLNPWPVIEIDKETGLVFVNNAAKKLLPDLESKNLNHPFLKDINTYFLKLNIKDKTETNREIKINDNYYFQALTLINPQQLRIYAIDVTDLKKAEGLIVSEKEKYKSLFSNMINGFAYHKIITDKNNKPIDYKFLEVNPAFEKLTGLKSSDIINKNVTNVIPGTEDDPADWIGKYGQIALTGQGASFESHSTAINKWFNISVYSPKKGYFATVFEDITDRKENEKRLLELDKLKDNFLSVTTHELKTPLTPIKSQSQLLLNGDYGPLNPEQRHAVAMIVHNEENLNRLTNDLMDISKIKSNKLKLILEKVKLNDIINNIIKDNSNLTKEKNITLSFEPLLNNLEIIADKLRITQIVSNLLNNAIKFTPDGGQIYINTEKNDNNVIITIKDTGIGIGQENIQKLFTPFFQIQSNLDRQYRGTGLGLAITKGIIEAHGGKIWIESPGEGQGSSFIFTLPIK